MAQAIEYSASPTGAAFHKSNKFIRCMLGPVGSGKSVTCIMEMLQRAIQQAPYNGIRKSRHAIIRNSYPELKTTTLATFSDWIPFAKINWQPPIKASIFIKDIVSYLNNSPKYG
jgi:type II secretory pathway predicted ATPase ExeA